MSHTIYIVPVHPERLGAILSARPHEALLDEAAEIIDDLGLELSPEDIVDQLLAALQNPINSRSRQSPEALVCLSMILATARSNWRPAFEASWSGGTYFEALEQLAETMPEWSDLLQCSLSGGLYGLECEDDVIIGYGTISPEDIRRVLPTFTPEHQAGYRAALGSSGEAREWQQVLQSLAMCDAEGLWLIHYMG